MNTRIILGLLIPTMWGLTTSAAEKPAKDGDAVQSVTVRQRVLIATIEDQPVEATNEITFPKNIVIKTNGVFKVGGGKERPLAEGQVLSRDGMLTSPDGSIVPAEDHLTSKGGRILVVRDGEAQPLTAPLQLKDGTRVHPDGRMVTTRNAVKRLLDGQIVRLSDSAIEATDTAQLQKGKVVLYKDGGRIELKPGQVIAMSDGSRIDARGVVIKRDGSQVQLTEGELYKFAGAGDGR